MTKHLNPQDDVFAPTAGNVDRAKYVRDDVGDMRDIKGDSPLDLHIIRLLNLHPSLKIKFRNQDLTNLDTNAKQLLLQDINDVLGVTSLNVSQ